MRKDRSVRLRGIAIASTPCSMSRVAESRGVAVLVVDCIHTASILMESRGKWLGVGHTFPQWGTLLPSVPGQNQECPPPGLWVVGRGHTFTEWGLHQVCPLKAPAP